MGLSFRHDWGAIQFAFDRMFNGLGDVHIGDRLLQYRSTPPSVSTGISITYEGVLVANMPLHEIQSTFSEISFQKGGFSLTLKGPGSSYTYTVPSEILDLRSI